MYYKIILNKIEKIFANIGFKPIIINNVKFFKYKECYCKITFLKNWSAFVIESADNIQDVKNNILEDGDLYYINIPETELLNQLKIDLIKYYIDD